MIAALHRQRNHTGSGKGAAAIALIWLALVAGCVAQPVFAQPAFAQPAFAPASDGQNSNAANELAVAETTQEPRRRPLTRSYSIVPHDGRSPSEEYRADMQLRAEQWLAKVAEADWKTRFSQLAVEAVDVPDSPLPQFLKVSGSDLELMIGLDDEIQEWMSAREVQNLINSVRIDSIPVSDLSTGDWKFEANSPRAFVVDNIRVAQFGDGVMTLVLNTGFSDIYGRDRRVVPGVPEDIFPAYGHFRVRKEFRGKITLEIDLATLKNASSDPTAGAIWREIGNEAWKLDRAPSAYELMSIYAGDHMKEEDGDPALTFRAHVVHSELEYLKNKQAVLATITVFNQLDDAVQDERWTGLALLRDGRWNLQRLWLSQKCRRGPRQGRWTSLPCR